MMTIPNVEDAETAPDMDAEVSLDAPVSEAEALAQRLVLLAQSVPGVTDRDRLKSLADALLGGPRLASWVGLQPQQIIDAEALAGRVEKETRFRWAMQVAEVGRNALLFAPVLFTWIALSRAVGAYHTLVQKQPAESLQPFLLLWQDGFRTGDPWMTLSRVALVDAVLVFILLGITLVTSWWNQHLASERQRRVTSLAADIYADLADAGILLGAHRRPPDVAVMELATVGQALLGDIRSEREQIAKLSSSQRRQSESLLKSFEALQTFTQRLDASANAIVGASEATREGAAQMAQASQAIAQAQTQLAESTTELTGGLTAMVSSQEVYGSNLNTAVERVSSTADALNQTERGTSEAASAMVASVEALVGVLSAERAAQETLALAVSSSALELEAVLRSMTQSEGATQMLAADVRDLARELPQATESLADVLPALVQQQAEIAAMIRDALAPASKPPARRRPTPDAAT